MLSLSVSGLWSASDNYQFNTNICFERVIQNVLQKFGGQNFKNNTNKKNLTGQ